MPGPWVREIDRQVAILEVILSHRGQAPTVDVHTTRCVVKAVVVHLPRAHLIICGATMDVPPVCQSETAREITQRWLSGHIDMRQEGGTDS
jgi:hypothetical protein